MVSLVDIVPQTRTVELAAGPLKLHPLGLRQIADLFLRFPKLRNLFTPNAPGLEVEDFAIMAPDAVGAIIAESARQPEAAEAIDSALPLEEIIECLTVVRDLTMPGGFVPLLERLGRLFGTDLAGDLSGRVPAMSAPLVPNSLSPADTTQPL
jgi:hypothetical protein